MGLVHQLSFSWLVYIFYFQWFFFFRIAPQTNVCNGNKGTLLEDHMVCHFVLSCETCSKTSLVQNYYHKKWVQHCTTLSLIPQPLCTLNVSTIIFLNFTYRGILCNLLIVLSGIWCLFFKLNKRSCTFCLSFPWFIFYL